MDNLYTLDERLNLVPDDESSIENPMICNHCGNTGKQLILFAFKDQGGYNDYYGTALTYCLYCSSTTVHFLNKDGDHYFTEKSIPDLSSKQTFSETFQKKFPQFVEIYEQSQSAEDQELNLIAGMGYRKAVEFLVTDYLLQFVDKSIVTDDWINNPSTTFNQKINKIQDNRIKSVAKAISWIGNDETHTIRRNPDYDITNMKQFIRALISLIEYEQTIQDAVKFTNNN